MTALSRALVAALVVADIERRPWQFGAYTRAELRAHQELARRQFLATGWQF